MVVKVDTTPTRRWPTAFGPAASMVERKAGAICSVLLNSNLLSPEQFMTAAMAEVNALELKYPKELDPGSVVQAVFNAASLGLVLGATRGHAYLVPYRKKGSDKRFVNLIPGYRGFIELAFRSQFLISLDTEIVLEGESFRCLMTEEGRKLRHRLPVERRADRDGKNVVAAYCVYQSRGGGKGITVVSRDEILAVRKDDSDTWRFSFPAMARKTSVRRASKNWSMSGPLAAAVYIDEQADRGEDQTLLVESRNVAESEFVAGALPASDLGEVTDDGPGDLLERLSGADKIPDGTLIQVAQVFCQDHPDAEYHNQLVLVMPGGDVRCQVMTGLMRANARDDIRRCENDLEAMNAAGMLSDGLYKSMKALTRRRESRVP